MFPVPLSERTLMDFAAVQDYKYKALLIAEYRIIKPMQAKILKNAAALYKHKLSNGDATPLAKRCNDFRMLETMCTKYNS